MELITVCEKPMTRDQRSDTNKDEHNAEIEQNTDNAVETITADSDLDTNMRVDTMVARSISMNSEVSNGDIDNISCENTTVDQSKDESDYSDYGEENTRCQLANQAVRAKLLSSVANPANGMNSKLRVSVFDHKIIPKKFIVPKRTELKTLDFKSSDNENQNMKNQDSYCDSVTDNKRKLSSLSYTVLKASKRYNQDNKCTAKSPTTPDSDNDVRIRFDILLRNLIGDVNDMKVEPSTVTVSSGYESDYTQNRDVDTKTSKVGNANLQQNESDKENILLSNQGNFKSTNYLSETGTGARSNMNASLHGSHGFSSLPAFPTNYQDQGSGIIVRSDTIDVPSMKCSQTDRDSKGFNYAQRHNYKLTKVTRSMYEIIHDLQNGEKPPNDGRKRSKKGRRLSTEPVSGGGDGLSSAGENRSRGRILSTNAMSDNNIESSVSSNKYPDVNTSPFSGSVVRCVRRPQCNEAQPIQRRMSQTDNSNRLLGSVANHSSNKVQNDLRNLLCGSSDVTGLSADDKEHQVDFNTLSGSNSTRGEFSSAVNGHVEDGFNQTNVLINNDQNLTPGQRRPTLNEQFMKRPKPDDHVYETIPGDEKFYEEWKKMQKNTKIPKIRRFTTIPDLPGTFIPKEPPALPERKYLNSNEPVNKESDNYIFMGDINSNFPAKDSASSKRSDSGFASVASDNLLERRTFENYPYPLNDVDVESHLGRTDETSDGYCSIDNLSLSRDFTESSVPVLPSSDWRAITQHSLPRRLPPPRNDYFFSPVTREDYKRTFPSTSSIHEKRSSRDNNFELSRPVVSSAFEEPKKPVFQATYV